jgi:hypothetical protein
VKTDLVVFKVMQRNRDHKPTDERDAKKRRQNKTKKSIVRVGIPRNLYKRKDGTKREYIGEFFDSECLDEVYNNEEDAIKWSDILQHEECNSEQLTALQLHHGDILAFDDYKMSNNYVVYQIHPKDEILLIPTLGEYGYSIPYEFSDAPLNYFLDGGADMLIDTRSLWGHSQVARLIEKHKLKTGYYYYNNNINKLSKGSCMDKESATSALKRFQDRKKRVRSHTLLIIQIVLIQLPATAAQLVAEYIV